MRVAQHKPSKPDEKPAAPPAEDGDAEEQVVTKDKPATILVAGVETQVSNNSVSMCLSNNGVNLVFVCIFPYFFY